MKFRESKCPYLQIELEKTKASHEPLMLNNV